MDSNNNPQFSNTSTGTNNAFTKGMVKDMSDIYIGEGMWTNAINAVNNSHNGETGVLGNEPSNAYCASAPYTIISILHKKLSEWVVFSTNDTNSEIGIFDESKCSYTKLVNDNCLGFKKSNLITGACKENYDHTYTVYFQDGLNFDRKLNLSAIPYLETGVNLSKDPDCYKPEYSSKLDCDALLLQPLISQPCVRIKKGQGSGQLNNGSYMAAVAYSENGIRLTDYSIPSAPQALWAHEGIGGSLEINLSGMDQDFPEFELVIIGIVNQQTVAKSVGFYSTRQSTVSLDFYGGAQPTVELKLIPLRSPVYNKSDKMFRVDKYLLRSGVTTVSYINYQEQANKIQIKWVSVEYPANYYFNGGNVAGYMRDEVYSFFIRWVYNTGARSASFHIPGRESTAADLSAVSGLDSLDATENQRWKVYDTSSKSPRSGMTQDKGVITASGKMGYWQSTERYPDNKPGIWGGLCGKYIRHHKMPSNETTHIHRDGVISILGVEFDNIMHPLDEFGKPMQSIVGYEILRGSRESNRSIVAKGLFNNLWEYDIKDSATKGLYQNYPYNDLREDKFLTTDRKTLEEGAGSPDKIEKPAAPKTYKKNHFSFHSVETNFVKPYLGDNHVKIYTEERGTVTGSYGIPYKQPKQKIITDGAYAIAAIVSVGLTMVAMIGKTTLSGEKSGAVKIFGTGVETKGIASREGSSLTAPTDFVAGYLTSVVGSTAAIVAVAVQGIATAAYFFGLSMDEVLGIMYKLANYRNYALQYNSHGVYDKHSAVSNAGVPSGIMPSFRRKVSASGAKYMGSGIHDVNDTHRVNNLNRNKFVAIELTADVPNPVSITDNTRQRMRDVKTLSHNDPFGEFKTDTVSYYGALKVSFDNQYGQLEGVVQLPVDSCVRTTEKSLTLLNSSGVLFGGDVYINRYTEKNPYYFFNDWLQGNADGTDFNYRNYVNGPIPRYWVDFQKFDTGDISVKLKFTWKGGFKINASSPSDFHRLDRKKNSGIISIRNAYFYMFCNGVRDFYTESELNMAFRDYGEEPFEKFYDVYGRSFNDLGTMFRADIITKPIYNKYDLSLSTAKLFNNFASWGSLLPSDYNPALYRSSFEYFPKRVVYSLPQQLSSKRDSWRNYLPLNYKDFIGKVNAIKSMNTQGAIILFEDAEPIQFSGSDQLQTKNGVKISIGDGGLFEQSSQSLVNADDAFNYGSSISSRGAVNTPFGLFYISQQAGKVMQYASNINEISHDGMKHWFLENLPSQLLEAFPNYALYDNPVAGVGCQSIYDSQYELLYLSKVDYVPLDSCIKYDPIIGFYTDCAETELICPPGYTKNITNGQCEKTTLSPALCPSGSVYDVATKSCKVITVVSATCVCEAQAFAADPDSICSGKNAVINITAPVAGTTFSWTVVQNGVSGAFAGSGNKIDQILLTTSTSDGTAVYTITPAYNGCIGPVLIKTIGVKAGCVPACNTYQMITDGFAFVNYIDCNGAPQYYGFTCYSSICRSNQFCAREILSSSGDHVVVSNGKCSPTNNPAPLKPATTLAPVAACLAAMEVIVDYTNSGCSTGHTCNGANFWVEANTVRIGLARLSNTGGTNDFKNYPPGVTSGTSRYDAFTITTQQAQDIAATSTDGNITFRLVCEAADTGVDNGFGPGGCHTSSSHMVIKLNNTVLYDKCPNGGTFIINPCTGVVTP
jgi:hypothetical protein